MSSLETMTTLAWSRSASASGIARSGQRRTAGFLTGLLGLGLLSVRVQAQTTWHVDAAAAPGGNGLTWATAMNSLQSALDVTSTADEIWVAAGTYRPTALSNPSDPRSARFWLHDPFQLFGGFDGTETSLSERDPGLFDDTILSGDIGIPADPSDNAFRVVEVSSGFPTIGFALLDGFHITDGNAVGNGGGVLVKGPGSGGTPPRVILRHCTLSANNALRGGALAVLDFGVAHLQRCSVTENFASSQGGAAYARAGVLRAVNTRFSDNKTANLGGALYADAQTVLDLVKFANCVFNGNDARLGGVAYLKGGASFAGAASWYNCTFVENQATQVGGVLYAITTTPVRAKAEIFDSILWNNVAPASPSIFGAGLDVRFSDVEAGYPGAGNVNFDPLFVTIDRPGAGSPVNDAGSNDLLVNDFLDLDADGDTNEQLPLDLLERLRRIDDPMAPDTGTGTPPIVDMGAYELDPNHGGP